MQMILEERKSPKIEAVEQTIEPGEEGSRSNKVQAVAGSPNEAKEQKMKIKIGGKV